MKTMEESGWIIKNINDRYELRIKPGSFGMYWSLRDTMVQTHEEIYSSGSAENQEYAEKQARKSLEEE